MAVKSLSKLVCYKTRGNIAYGSRNLTASPFRNKAIRAALFRSTPLQRSEEGIFAVEYEFYGSIHGFNFVLFTKIALYSFAFYAGIDD